MDVPGATAPTMSRRERRRRETIEEILALSLEVMRREGVERLNLTAVAKGLGVQPTAIYKYFPSLAAVYDALFRQAIGSLSEAFKTAIADTAPGMATIRAAVRAGMQWNVSNPELGKLLLLRPTPGYTAPADALTPSVTVLGLLAQALDDAAAAGEIDAEAAGMRGAHILGVLIMGSAGLYYSDAENTWEPEAFVEFVSGLVDMFTRAYTSSTRPAYGTSTPV
jgi:AcrR family transcriptional regulator